MIATLTGKVTHKLADALVLEIGGVGYEVFVTVEDWGAAKVGEGAVFYIHEQIREDAHNLYGFSSSETKDFFTKLIGISGIGPKVAMSILSAANLSRLQQAITSGDPDLLKGVSGVGKKTAERIIVELRGKLKSMPTSAAAASDSAYQALISLGFTPSQAAEAVASLPTDVTDEQERIKLALQGAKR